MQKFIVLLAVLAFALAASAQSNYGAITGSVTDVQHLRIAGAAVQLQAVSTGAVRRIVANEQGIFDAAALLPDDYVLTSEAPGFATSTRSLRLEVGQKLAVDIMLTVGPVREGVKVTGEGEVLHIPSNVPHSAVAIEDTVDLDIFSPIRTDWLTRQDEYLRRGERAG